MEFFIIDRNGQQAGPFSFDQLVQKGISPETLVWKQGMADWTPAWKVEELRAVLEAIRANQQQAQQQDYQKAQQEAYQQGFQQGAAMNSNFQQQPKKKTSHFAMKLVIGLIIFILAIFAVTNPGADAHKEKVRTEASKALEKAVGSTDNNFFSQALRSVAQMMAGSMMDEAMNQLFEYHNYIVCSTGSVEFNGKPHTVSFGILGNVYTMNADDMVKALEEANANEDQADSDEGNFSTRMQKKLEEKANQAFDKAADKVSKKVEEKINQKLEETTDSSSIEKIIDKILELF
ncbi:GYF domain-containing protein [Prevotella copri]|uniref:GYF domain-containing protein n=1 Tax=Segatella copri TaxID=165179 RepID=A0AAP3F914_9BACT|nr:GYF domain-containing protein [Segatella copri]MCW4127312.1 GYF domain-containing protein [Segatella copri]MCW4414274.1 GYF domain-containing protein [Segatella copri]MCW4420389.1 GYF domain-containing protein [Segatella copri]